MPTKSTMIVGGLVGGAIVIFLLGGWNAKKNQEVDDVLIDPALGKHRGLPAIYGGPDNQQTTRMPSVQDPKGGNADWLGYPYKGTQPGIYAKGEPAQHGGAVYDKREDAWAPVLQAPIDYGAPPLRIPKLWKDAIRYWDGLASWGGTEVVGQRLHLYHLRPSAPTRGYRSISGVFAPTGGGQTTASRVRIPAVFVPSVVS